MSKKITTFVDNYACSLSHLLCLSIGVWTGVYCCYLIDKPKIVYPVLISAPEGVRIEVFDSRSKQLNFMSNHSKAIKFEEVVK